MFFFRFLMNSKMFTMYAKIFSFCLTPVTGSDLTEIVL